MTFLDNSFKKWSKAENANINIKLYIFEIVKVPNLRLN